MRLTTVVFCLAAAVMLAGCAVSPKPRLSTFNPEDYEPYVRSGTGRIVGQAFLVTRGGDVKLGAGRQVILNPVTPYSTEHYERHVLKGEPLEQPDPRVSQYSRETIADGEGRFRFDNLPAGEYYVLCWITWEVATGRYSTYQTGGIAHAKVTVREGETAEVVVTR